MKPVKRMTDDELKYAASDLRTVIAVPHPSHHSNMNRYLADYRAVTDEQDLRDRKRTFRHMLFDTPSDPLAPLPWPMKAQIRGRNRLKGNSYAEFNRKQGRSAAWQLGWIRLREVS